MQLSSHPVKSLRGVARIPGDKSISHRALMLGAVAKGETIISNLLDAADVRATAAALRAMGIHLYNSDDGLWHVHGKGPDHLRSPAQVLDLGNSGTGVRLLAGLAAGCGITATFAGDTSLHRRPMGRVLRPLQDMGADVLARDGDYLPFTLRGPETVKPIEYELPVASAQVKSALLLAGLFANGATIIREPRATRDHTEHMLRHMGAEIDSADGVVTLRGGKMLEGAALDVPGDPSAAAFITTAALLCGDADIKMTGIGQNKTRIGFYDVLRDMGADITGSHQKTVQGETVATIHVRGGAELSAVDVAPERIPAMIDEIPILAVVAAHATGVTRLRGLAELRVKESDRVSLTASGLAACGARVSVEGDDLLIHGSGGKALRGGVLVETAMDHRIAMSFLVLGTASAAPVSIDDDRFIATSFPDFIKVMNGLGARIGEIEEYVLP